MFYPASQDNRYPATGGFPGVEAKHGVHQHDGFLLRVTLGLGRARSQTGQDGTEVRLGGGAVFSGLDLGGAVADNLVVFGRVGGFQINRPEMVVGGEPPVAIDEGTLALSLLGLGVSYYFMPGNVYLGGAVGITTAEASPERVMGTSLSQFRPGMGCELDLGKEWWVGDDWGLGVAARLSILSVPQQTSFGARDWLSLGLGVLFSATYN